MNIPPMKTPHFRNICLSLPYLPRWSQKILTLHLQKQQVTMENTSNKLNTEMLRKQSLHIPIPKHE